MGRHFDGKTAEHRSEPIEGKGAPWETERPFTWVRAGKEQRPDEEGPPWRDQAFFLWKAEGLNGVCLRGYKSGVKCYAPPPVRALVPGPEGRDRNSTSMIQPVGLTFRADEEARGRKRSGTARPVKPILPRISVLKQTCCPNLCCRATAEALPATICDGPAALLIVLTTAPTPVNSEPSSARHESAGSQAVCKQDQVSRNCFRGRRCQTARRPSPPQSSPQSWSEPIPTSTSPVEGSLRL